MLWMRVALYGTLALVLAAVLVGRPDAGASPSHWRGRKLLVVSGQTSQRRPVSLSLTGSGALVDYRLDYLTTCDFPIAGYDLRQGEGRPAYSHDGDAVRVVDRERFRRRGVTRTIAVSAAPSGDAMAGTAAVHEDWAGRGTCTSGPIRFRAAQTHIEYQSAWSLRHAGG